MRGRHRLGKLLLRRGLLYPGSNVDERAPASGSQQLEWPHAAERHVVADYLLRDRPTRGAARRTRSRARRDRARRRRIARAVAALRCFRGIDTLIAMTLLAELHDLRRFPHPRALMAFLGLVPSEHSTRRPSPAGRRSPSTGNTPGAPPADRSRVALSASARVSVARLRRGAPASPPAVHRDRDPGRAAARAAAIGGSCARHKPKPLVDRRHRARTRRLSLGDAATAGRRACVSARSRLGRGAGGGLRHDPRIRELRLRHGPAVRIRAARLHVLSTDHDHVCAARSRTA